MVELFDSIDHVHGRKILLLIDCKLKYNQFLNKFNLAGLSIVNFFHIFEKNVLTIRNKYIINTFSLWGCGGTGRRARLKILWPQAVSVRV